MANAIFFLIIFQSQGQALRLYYLFEPSLQEGKSQTYEILLREVRSLNTISIIFILTS